jgi:hypothetical protein
MQKAELPTKLIPGNSSTFSKLFTYILRSFNPTIAALFYPYTSGGLLTPTGSVLVRRCLATASLQEGPLLLPPSLHSQEGPSVLFMAREVCELREKQARTRQPWRTEKHEANRSLSYGAAGYIVNGTVLRDMSSVPLSSHRRKIGRFVVQPGA